MLVRPRGRAFTACRVAAVTQVELPDGTPVTVHPDWWIISDGPRALAVVPPAHFTAQYEPAEQTALALTPEQCTAIEAVLGLGACKDAGALLAAAMRVSQLRIGGIDLKFTPGQMEELKRRASKNNRTIKQELQLVVDRLKDDIFWGGLTPRPEAPNAAA